MAVGSTNDTALKNGRERVHFHMGHVESWMDLPLDLPLDLFLDLMLDLPLDLMLDLTLDLPRTCHSVCYWTANKCCRFLWREKYNASESSCPSSG